MKVLVAVASKYGSTAEIADVIGHALRRYNYAVDVKSSEDVDEVDSYDAAVVGSAVYAGHWLESARSLVEMFGPALASKPVWLFSSGPLGHPPRPEGDPVDVEAMRLAIQPRDHQVFAGKLDRSKLNFIERAMATAFRAPEGDHREWPAIEEWARGIARELAR